MKPLRSLSDSGLLRRMRRGEEDAFGVLYGRYSRPVYRFVLHMTGKQESAEEITQETFLVLIRRPQDYNPERGSVAAWLLGIARMLVRRIEQPTRRLESIEDFGEWPASCDVLNDLTRRETVDAVRDAVLTLPPVYREAIVLCEFEELDYAHAAAVLDCPVGTVRSRLHRARNLLASKLQTRCFA